MRLLDSRASRRGWAIVAAAAAVLLTVAVVVTFVGSRITDPTEPSAGSPSSPSVVASPPPDAGSPVDNGPGPTRPRDDSAAEVELARLRAITPVVAGLGTPKITGEASTQPDLYAAELVRRLLTQDYQQPRAEWLRWVQAESATTIEPLVVGKVPPELRDRLAVFSVTDQGPGPAPIPSRPEWDGLALQHGYTTVTVDRVTEPFAWTNAVASGRVTDPGITGREVTATVTRHTSVNGHKQTATFSVAVTLNLEGPPTRRGWGLVAVISYTRIQTR